MCKPTFSAMTVLLLEELAPPFAATTAVNTVVMVVMASHKKTPSRTHVHAMLGTSVHPVHPSVPQADGGG